MTELYTKYGIVKIFAKTVEQEALSQVMALANSPLGKGADIRIMPDVHAGAGCVIGTTMKITDKIVPNLVGVDIACGMETAVLDETDINLQQLDKTIHEYIPAGFETRKKPHQYIERADIDKLCCAKHVDMNRARLSLGTLGGGNHFIELAKDDEGRLHIVVHSGSRNLGKQTAEWYQRLAFETMKKRSNDKSALINELKAAGRESDIQAELKKTGELRCDKDLAWLEGANFDEYLHDMKLIQNYATLSRKAMINEIVTRIKLSVKDSFTTLHNYVDTDAMILRKGAISAKAGERVLIPMNMRDGSLICVGKGNPDWNCSAPHGAGRLMSRSAAKSSIALNDFVESMRGVYSTTVNRSTLDEAPSAYKPMEEIIDCIGGTAEIVKAIKPVYNFKAAE